MNQTTFRRLMVLLHLFAASFMLPAFGLVAITGGLHMVGGGEKLETQSVTLPAGTTLDFKSPTLEADVRELFKQNDIDVKFGYIKNRGRLIQTRPTSRTYVEIAQTPKGLQASIKKPNFQKAMMEIHKGHGPKILRSYHKLVALVLVLVILSGFLAGIFAKTYRRKTLIGLIIGSALYIALIMFG
ncbi:MAG: hypothetical protein ABJG88_02550 [Litorimonas sp.]